MAVVTVSIGLALLPVVAVGQSPMPRGSAAPGTSSDPGVVVFSGSGPGEMRTEPFALEPGDLRLTYTVQAPSDEEDCGMGFALVAPDGSYHSGIGRNGADVAAGSPYQNETWFFVPTAGSYALEIGGDCDWTATLAAVASPFNGDPVVVTGSGPQMSPSFPLAAGDHVLRYRATNPSSAEACIFFGPGIIRQGATSSSVGDPIDTVVEPGATLEGEVPVVGLEAGTYALFINHAWCSTGLAEPIAWEVMIDPS
jgi:hypothetical protein